MITLFSMMIADDWSGSARPVYEEQPPVVLFFFLYTVMLTMGLLNVVTGMVVDTVNQVKAKHDKEEQEQQKENQKRRLADVVDIVFKHSTHEITEEEFVSHSSRGELVEMLEIVDFPHHFTLRDFFTILDSSGHKTLYKSQFIDGLVTLINSNTFHRECQILLGVHKLRRTIVEVRKELATLHHRMRETVKPHHHHHHHHGHDPHGQTAPHLIMAPQQTRGHMIDQQAYAKLLSASPKEIRALSAELRQKREASCDHWEQLRSTLHDAAMEHCFEELRLAWAALELEYRTGESGSKNQTLTPSPAPPDSPIAEIQEQWYVWHKLYGAVSSESLQDLRQGLEHARNIGIGEKSCAILFTFCDALSRHQQIEGFSSTEVVQALDRGDWMRALDLVIEISLARGADKSLLLNALARLCAESGGYDAPPANLNQSRTNSRQAQANGAPSGKLAREQLGPQTTASTLGVQLDFAAMDNLRAKTMTKVLKPVEMTEDMRGRLVAVLHTEAADHAERELKKAWEELDRAYRSAELVAGHAGAFGPGYTPFSRHEELFFIRNQINNAVLQESLLELRRSLSHAMSFGIDMRSMEIEVAYRDALSRHLMGEGFSSAHISQALERGDWWSAMDDIIGASFARGADRHMLVKMIAKVCSPTSHFPKMDGGNALEDRKPDDDPEPDAVEEPHEPTMEELQRARIEELQRQAGIQRGVGSEGSVTGTSI